MGVTRARLLLVDALPHARDRLEAVLEPIGCDVTRATDLRSALESVAREPPDCALVDLATVGLEGFESLLRSPAGDVTIVMTSAEHAGRRAWALDAGAPAWLDRPVDAALAAAQVRAVLRRKASADEHRDLMGLVLHDLRNPLSALALNLECLEQIDVPPDLAGALDDAIAATGRLQALVEDLRVLAHEDAPRDPEHVDLGALTSEIVRATSRRHPRRIELAAPPGAGVALGERAVLSRIVTNLIEGAVRHAVGPSPVVVEVRGASEVLLVASLDGSPCPTTEECLGIVRAPSPRPTSLGFGLAFSERALRARGGAFRVVEAGGRAATLIAAFPAA